jgi:hypothetical protein
MNELKFVILGCNDADDGTKLERHLFGIDNDGLECGKEAGMTEHEFAEFVESLDRDLIGDEEKSTLKEPQDSKGVLMMD